MPVPTATPSSTGGCTSTEGWLADPAKRNVAPGRGARGGASFATKLELAGEMLTAAIERGHLPCRVGHRGRRLRRQRTTSGRSWPSLGRWYCFEVSGTTEVWTADPAWAVPPTGGPDGPAPHEGAAAGRQHRGPPRSCATSSERCRPTPGSATASPRARRVPASTSSPGCASIEKRPSGAGARGLAAGPPPGRRADATAEIKCYLSNAPATVALAEMAAVGCLRWTIEEDFELAKGEVGLDQYEVTKFRGWYHHITLSLLALAFLKAVQREWGKKWGPGIRAGDPPAA